MDSKGNGVSCTKWPNGSCEDQACLVGPEVNQHPHWYYDKKNPKIHANYYFKILKNPMLERNQSWSLSSNLPFFGLNMATKRSH
jgi:hypothetical protein